MTFAATIGVIPEKSGLLTSISGCLNTLHTTSRLPVSIARRRGVKPFFLLALLTFAEAYNRVSVASSSPSLMAIDNAVFPSEEKITSFYNSKIE